MKQLKAKLNKKQFDKIVGSADEKRYVWDEAIQSYVLTLRTIRGVAAGKKNAKVFHLATDAGTTGRMYLTREGKLSYNRKEAMFFHYGYDNPASRVKHWTEVTKVKLYDCN